ncbi:MAG: WYL domain-containing protein [Betaproteobacteria bacterium]|nr:WYL domain-containing protein [Betaproteobacteria bacterium]
MIDRQEILEFAGEVGLDPNVVEKDYVLGWMLAGISRHPRTRDSWLFKGGTCLKKCYFETYRFSEDLDFTLLAGSQVDEAFLRATFAEIAQWVYDESGIEFPDAARVVEIYTNPRGNTSAQGRIGYRGPMQRQADVPRIRFDLTNDERVVRAGERRRVHHPYSDEPAEGIHVLAYCFEEVFAEKLRALAERERPRDLYDVIHLHRHETGADRAAMVEILRAKCEFKGIAVPTLESLRASPQHGALRADWEQMLAHQLPQLPPFDSFWNELPGVFAWLQRQPAKPQPPVIGPGRHQIDPVWRAPAMASSWRMQGITAPLEIIRFAAANRLCVEFDYEDESGHASTRTIEPYSLRRTKAGDLLLYAVRSQDGQDRSYRVDRIRGARATQQTFVPRYAVELSATGPIHAPGTARSAPTRGSSVFSSPRRTTSRTSSGFGRSRPLGQMRYVFQCTYCQKKFERSQ